MNTNKAEKAPLEIWKTPATVWGLLGIALLLVLAIFREGFEHMFYMWFNKEEYSHAVLIPFISMFLVWQKKDVLERVEFSGSWLGMLTVLLAVFLLFLGKQSALIILVHYGLLTALLGLAWAYMGWRAFRVVLVPLLMLFFTIPLPGFLYESLSNDLQLLSSKIGVWFIRLFDISVYLEGNVIDLGNYKLQVVEACSGLRYLFPLMTLGFIAGYFFKGAMWKRVLIFLSSIPITVLMNSFRIGAIGVMVEYWGPGMAEGFLHDFEGWAVFMTCMAVLIAEMWILAHIGKDRKPLRVAFGLDFPEPPPRDATVRLRSMPRPLQASTAVLAVILLVSATIPRQSELIPERRNFAEFPLAVGDWKGNINPLEQIYVDALRFDDYTQASFQDKDGNVVNLFTSYYASQLGGNMPHSPKACLPGGGWNIVSSSEIELPGMSKNGKPFVVNRVVIQKGEYRQLVYYWFQQRGRIVANEFLVKWYIFWDSLTRHRSDGSLVRLTIFVPPGEDLSQAEANLTRFARQLESVLPAYIPD